MDEADDLDDVFYPDDDAGSLHALASVGPGGSPRVAAVARGWLREGADRLLGDMTAVETKTPGVAGSVIVAPGESDPLRARPYSRRGWEAALSAAGVHPVHVSVGLRSRRPQAVYTSADVTVARAGTSSPWARLIASATLGPGFAPEVHAEQWVRYLGDVLDTADPAYAQISDLVGSEVDTALDMYLRRSDVSVQESRTTLRGYAWVTVVPKELVETLGGVAALAESPAVMMARPLSAGGALLQATPTPAEFDSDAMHRLFRLLAPVLPPGMPRPMPGWEGLPVVLKDAAAVR